MDRPVNPVLPEWMHDLSKPSPLAASLGNGKRLSGFSQETTRAFLFWLQNTIFTEATARFHGLLQALDPRVKLLCALTLLVAVSFPQSLQILATVYTGVFVLALLSGIKPLLFLKRVWLFVPLFSGVMAFPVTLNWVTPGNPVWTVYQLESPIVIAGKLLPATLAVTDAGMIAACRFILRVATSVSIAVLLVLTTPWQELLRALRVLGVPQFFVFILGMSYRYIHLLIRLLLDMHLGRRSRTLCRTGWKQDHAWMTNRAGYLFKRSQVLSESVYQAMLSRGFLGEPKLLDELRWQPKDWVVLAAVMGLCVGIVLLNSH